MKRHDVKALRHRVGTQQAFADLMGIGLRTVRRWEVGDAAPSPLAVKRLRQVARYLDHQAQSGAGPASSSPDAPTLAASSTPDGPARRPLTAESSS